MPLVQGRLGVAVVVSQRQEYPLLLFLDVSSPESKKGRLQCPMLPIYDVQNIHALFQEVFRVSIAAQTSFF